MEDLITAKELKKKEKQVCIIDVREADEFQAGHIQNAINYPLGKLMRDESKGLVPRDKEIVVHCRSGFRGDIAKEFLKQRGYKVKNLAGGYLAYCQS